MFCLVFARTQGKGRYTRKGTRQDKHCAFMHEDTPHSHQREGRANAVTCAQQAVRALANNIQHARAVHVVDAMRPELTSPPPSAPRRASVVDFWCVHPGGRRIIEEAQNGLGLTEEQTSDSWAVLGEYGNMLSPSVMFVLSR